MVAEHISLVETNSTRTNKEGREEKVRTFKNENGDMLEFAESTV